MRIWFIRVAFLLFAATVRQTLAGDATVRVGAKAFTEQHILGELVAQLIEENTDLQVERVFDLGGTGICHEALRSGQIDIYVEYTGTALMDILKEPPANDSYQVLRRVSRLYRERFGLVWLPPLGFNNTFSLAVKSDVAAAKGWRKISDLPAVAPTLRGGFTSEFIERADGYRGLKKTYGLHLGRLHDLDPGLMYQALAGGQVDVICAFSTDSRVATYKFTVLEDDRSFFPPYDAAPVIRSQTLQRHPEIAEALCPLIKTIDDHGMRALNAAVDEHKRRPADAAREWIRRIAPVEMSFAQNADLSARPIVTTFFTLLHQRRAELLQKTGEHLGLTGIAICIALLVGVPTGIFIYRLKRFAQPVLSAAEIIQTVPSLAMLAFLFAIYQMLGAVPAITALVLYSLLPIILNTLTGLESIAPETHEAAVGLGMSGAQRLWMIELPLALPILMAGVRTATVWTIGIATLSTYIGAGGLGDFISRGLARNDPALTMLGAIPAALIAIVFSFLVRRLERALVWR